MILDLIAWGFAAGALFSTVYFLIQDSLFWSLLSLAFAVAMIDFGILLMPL